MNTCTTQAALHSLELSEAVISASDVFQPGILAGLGDVFLAEDVPSPDWAAMQQALAALLDQATQEVRRTDEVHRLHLVDDAELRRRRREVAERLRERRRGLQKLFAGYYGEAALVSCGLASPPARGYLALREQMRIVLAWLRDPALAGRLPPSSVGVPLDLAAIASALEGDVEELAELVSAILEQHALLVASLLKKREALLKHRRIYVHVTRILESLCGLAGLDELARRIRLPERPRRRMRIETSEVPADSMEVPANSNQAPRSIPALAEPARLVAMGNHGVAAAVREPGEDAGNVALDGEARQDFSISPAQATVQELRQNLDLAPGQRQEAPLPFRQRAPAGGGEGADRGRFRPVAPPQPEMTSALEMSEEARLLQEANSLPRGGIGSPALARASRKPAMHSRAFSTASS